VSDGDSDTILVGLAARTTDVPEFEMVTGKAPVA
jgi:hypothetical protein